MAGIGDTFENDLLKLIFQAVAIANLAQNGVAPITDLSVALHTADPTDSGDQTSSETAYTGYARVSVVRTSSGWAVSGNSISPVANIVFGECTASAGGAITFASVGPTGGGATKLMYYGALTPSITMAVGVIPTIKTTSTITED